MRRIGLFEIVVATTIFSLGWALRWWHLGTPSLWWDELVHLAFATGGDVSTVFRQVQQGVFPGRGNAGAVPLDYVLLNLWTVFVGRPTLEHLEAYYRFPSYVWSGLTLVAFWAYCRGTFGRTVAMVGTLLLALSVPHILYAAEARSYSLLMLMSVLNLATFTWVMGRPDLARAWVAYGIVNVVFFLAGLLSVLVLPWQFVALALVVFRDDRAGTWLRRLGLLALTVSMLGGALALYYGDTDLGAQGNRPGAGLLRASDLVRAALDFMTLGDPYQIALYALGALVAPLYCARRRRDLLPIVLTLLVIEALSVPLLTKVLQWKRYYFHPRHALFLLPGLELLAAIGLTVVCAWFASWLPGVRTSAVRRGAIGIAAVLVVLWIRVPMVRAFMTQPHGYFLWTKTERDFKTLARDLRARTIFYRPDEKYLLIVDHIGAGYLANPTLARYLRWYSIEHRVVLLSTTDITSALENLEHGCDGSCRGRPGEEVARALYLASPFELAAAKLRLLGLGPSFGSWPGVVRDAGVLLYPESNRRPDLSNANISPYMGALVVEPRWEDP